MWTVDRGAQMGTYISGMTKYKNKINLNNMLLKKYYTEHGLGLVT